jgi:hypothetical protein
MESCSYNDLADPVRAARQIKPAEVGPPSRERAFGVHSGTRRRTRSSVWHPKEHSEPRGHEYLSSQQAFILGVLWSRTAMSLVFLQLCVVDMSMTKLLSKASSVKSAATQGQSRLLTSRTWLQRTGPRRAAERNDVVDALRALQSIGDRRDLGSMEDESLPTSGYGRSGATPSSDSAATPGAAGLGPGLGSVLGSFIHVRDCSPVVTRIVFARLADGGGRR